MSIPRFKETRLWHDSVLSSRSSSFFSGLVLTTCDGIIREGIDEAGWLATWQAFFCAEGQLVDA